MKKFFIVCMVLMAPAFSGSPALSEDGGMGLDDIFGVLTDENQDVEEEEVSTASAIRGLNPVAEKYGAGRRDLARYVPEVRKMEQRKISKRDLRKFLRNAGLGVDKK